MNGVEIGYGQNIKVVVSSGITNQEDAINAATIAIRGKYTTANFLLSLAYPQAQRKKEMLFSEIEAAVLNGEVDAGLIIHENRFTYHEKGLKKIMGGSKKDVYV